MVLSLKILAIGTSIKLFGKRTSPTGVKAIEVAPPVEKTMSEIIEDFTYVEVKGATHMVPQDAPKDFEKIVRRFIRKYI